MAAGHVSSAEHGLLRRWPNCARAKLAGSLLILLASLLTPTVFMPLLQMWSVAVLVHGYLHPILLLAGKVDAAKSKR